MSRPKFFRDPIHLQIRFDPVDVREELPATGSEARQSWLLRNIIDSNDFQRLRLIRQNGLANLVFHGAEHSRFNHSMGVMYLARTMYGCIIRNMGEQRVDSDEIAVVAAALLHDIGHGPFSHTMEEVLKELSIDFHHEAMTTRFLLEDGSINKLLKNVDRTFPEAVAAFIDKKRRPADNWKYKIVSSQLDADRLDYLLRDAYFCGLKGHGFDHHRILDLLQHHDNTQIGIEAGALEAVEAYLVALDQLYRSIYYHHAVRAANRLLTSTIKRAVFLARDGDKVVLGASGAPFRELIKAGKSVDLGLYSRLGEHHIWALIDNWRDHKDKTLKDLSTRLLGRNLPKTVSPDGDSLADLRRFVDLINRAKDLAVKHVDYIDKDNVDLYICADEPQRTSYKTYDWKPDSWNDSIWIMEEGQKAEPLEDYERSKIVQGLKKTQYFPRLMLPSEVKELLRN